MCQHRKWTKKFFKKSALQFKSIIFHHVCWWNPIRWMNFIKKHKFLILYVAEPKKRHHKDIISLLCSLLIQPTFSRIIGVGKKTVCIWWTILPSVYTVRHWIIITKNAINSQYFYSFFHSFSFFFKKNKVPWSGQPRRSTAKWERWQNMVWL